jgi:hypothetical protein
VKVGHGEGVRWTLAPTERDLIKALSLGLARHKPKKRNKKQGEERRQSEPDEQNCPHRYGSPVRKIGFLFS